VGYRQVGEETNPSNGNLGAVVLRKYEKDGGTSVLQIAIADAGSAEAASVALDDIRGFLRQQGYDVRDCPDCVDGEDRFIAGHKTAPVWGWAYAFRRGAVVVVINLVEPDGRPAALTAADMTGLATIVDGRIRGS
jgi:hypothetical protein